MAQPVSQRDRTALDRFSTPTREWFRSAFAEPTPAQVQAWEATADGASVLVSAPTGSGKTLAAFLAALDRLLRAPAPADRTTRTRVLYVSPLKALAYDVDRNLRAPLTGIRQVAARLGIDLAAVTVGMRTGDTPADQRRRLVSAPPDILITTPESLFLLLTSRARQMLAGVETVIIDEVHAVAGSKRGAHLAVTLERLEALVAEQREGRPLQRVGLSATQRPIEVSSTRPKVPGANEPCRSSTSGPASGSMSRSSCRWRTWAGSARCWRSRPVALRREGGSCGAPSGPPCTRGSSI
jgi:ATP-dependent Lhr-like helicase